MTVEAKILIVPASFMHDFGMSFSFVDSSTHTNFKLSLLLNFRVLLIIG